MSDFNTCFQPHQIVYLEHQKTRLYAEVIQEIRDRKMCWVRPLVLVVDSVSLSPEIYDLRSTSDLVWYSNAFDLALDTDVIPFLAKLESLENVPGARRQLHHFIQEIWQKE